MIKSLLHFNNPDDLTKDEVKGVPWQINGTVASSQDGKFRNCLSITREGYLYAEAIDLFSLAKEWTLDMWVYQKFSKPYQPFLAIGSDIIIDSDELCVPLGGPNYWTKSLNLPVDRWVHFALVNQSQTLYAFVDGVKQIERTNQDIVHNIFNKEIRLGSSINVAEGFIGLIDEVRISDEALWTSDFTPPATEYHQDKYKFIYIDKNNTVMGMRE